MPKTFFIKDKLISRCSLTWWWIGVWGSISVKLHKKKRRWDKVKKLMIKPLRKQEFSNNKKKNKKNCLEEIKPDTMTVDCTNDSKIFHIIHQPDTSTITLLDNRLMLSPSHKTFLIRHGYVSGWYCLKANHNEDIFVGNVDQWKWRKGKRFLVGYGEHCMRWYLEIVKIEEVMVLIRNSDHWISLEIVIITDGDDWRWWWLEMVMIGDGDDWRSWWLEMVTIGDSDHWRWW